MTRVEGWMIWLIGLRLIRLCAIFVLERFPLFTNCRNPRVWWRHLTRKPPLRPLENRFRTRGSLLPLLILDELEGGGRSRSARPPRADGRAPSTGVESCSPLFLLSLSLYVSVSLLSFKHHLTHTAGRALLCSLIIIIVVVLFFFCSLQQTPNFFFREKRKKRKKSCGKQTPERASRSRKTRARTTSTKSRHLFCFAPLPTQPAQRRKSACYHWYRFSCVSSCVCDKKTCLGVHNLKISNILVA